MDEPLVDGIRDLRIVSTGGDTARPWSSELLSSPVPTFGWSDIRLPIFWSARCYSAIWRRDRARWMTESLLRVWKENRLQSRLTAIFSIWDEGIVFGEQSQNFSFIRDIDARCFFVPEFWEGLITFFDCNQKLGTGFINSKHDCKR